jgi:site-specific DNA-cytosine methylase
VKVAVICEFSGTVRDAFTKLGHDAISFDLLPSETEGNHYQGDIMEIPLDYWEQFDLAICHPPCTHLAVSGAAWFKYKQKEQAEALDFVRYLMALPISKIAIENPVSVISSHIRKPDQIVQPYMFGHKEQKKTCLWLKNLPKLIETNNVFNEMMLLPKRERERLHYLPPSPDRWKLRSKTYSGIAKAMAEQWGAMQIKDVLGAK